MKENYCRVNIPCPSLKAVSEAVHPKIYLSISLN
jgi:hypothetical protein